MDEYPVMNIKAIMSMEIWLYNYTCQRQNVWSVAEYEAISAPSVLNPITLTEPEQQKETLRYCWIIKILAVISAKDVNIFQAVILINRLRVVREQEDRNYTYEIKRNGAYNQSIILQIRTRNSSWNILDIVMSQIDVSQIENNGRVYLNVLPKLSIS